MKSSSYVAMFTYKSLFQNLIYCSAKSRRQTTPNLFQNPRLTSKGIVVKKPRSYDYDLPKDLPNRHLYWNRSQMNKKYRKRYNLKRLQKLGIPAIHDSKGVRLFQRQYSQILRQLSDLNLIRSSTGRTFENIKEMISRFPEQTKRQREVLLFALKDMHNRKLVSFNLYNFIVFCEVSEQLSVTPSEQMMVNFYKHVEGSYEMQDNKFKILGLCKTVNYLFGSREYPMEKYRDNFYKFDLFANYKLFEDNPPQFRSFEQMIPKLYSEQYIRTQLAKKIRKNFELYGKALDGLSKIPGGDQLKAKLVQASGVQRQQTTVQSQ